MAQNEPPDTEKTPLIVDERSTVSRRGNCCRVLREEFRLRKFCFDFHNAGAFYKSQWRLPRLVFVAFRLCLAIYTGTICILTLVYFPKTNPHMPWPAWLSNWCYLMLTLHEVCAATIAVVHSTEGTVGFCCTDVEDLRRERMESDAGFGDGRDGSAWSQDKRNPCYVKLDWLLFVVASTPAVSIGFKNALILIIDPSLSEIVTVKGFNIHFMNGIVILLEFCIAAVPVRLLHVIYPMIYYCVYFLFSLILWSLDHTGNVLYPGLIDWNDPATTVKSLLLYTLVICPVAQIVFFAIYRLRLFIYSKVFGNDERSFEPVYDY